MQATQSSTASGKTCRTEQFAALRYISRQMEVDADPVQGASRRRFGPPGLGAGEFDIAHDAASLLAVLSLYSELLARPDLSWDEHLEYAAQLKLLTDQSWELVGRFLRRSRVKNGWEDERQAAVASASVPAYARESLPCDENGVPVRRGPTRESGMRVVVEGAAGWIAC